jgi:hypothetical protein
VNSDSLDPFPSLEISLEHITLTLLPKDYIVFVSGEGDIAGL